MTEPALHADTDRAPTGFTEVEMVLLRRYHMDPIFHAKVVTTSAGREP